MSVEGLTVRMVFVVNTDTRRPKKSMLRARARELSFLSQSEAPYVHIPRDANLYSFPQANIVNPVRVLYPPLRIDQ